MKSSASASPSTVAGAAPRGLPALDGRVMVVLAAVVAVAFALGARSSPAGFLALAVAVLAVAAFAAMRWPLPTLVASAILTTVDLKISPRLLPAGLDAFPIGLSEPLLAVVGLSIAIGAVRRGTFLGAFRDPVLPLALLFVGLAVVSAVVNATPPVVALLGIVMTLDALAIYFTVRMVPLDERAATAAIAAIVLAVVAAAVFGLVQAVLGPDLLGFTAFRGNHGEGARITSFFGNPNMLAAGIGLAIPFALFASLRLENARWRWAARVALFVLACALLLTFSRGAWLAVALGGIIGGLLVDWRAVPLLVLTVALAWGAVTVMPRATFPERAAGAQTDDGERGSESGGGRTNDGEGGGEGGTTPDADGPSIVDSTIQRLGDLGTRGRYLREGIPIILDHPFLGVGPGRYGGAAAKIIPSPVYEEYGTRLFGYRTVHNFWLHLLGEAGALGTAVFLTIIAGLLIRFVRAARTATGPRFVVLAGATTMLLVAVFHSFAEMIFEGNMPMLIIWLILGIASLLAPSLRLMRRPEQPEAAAT